ncbi:thioredoxin family protein [Alkalicaulis satelles]|uniref:Thioredoxin family protein n=1 Tax=Alkalicaulis satelles TaxID=2609175 RepID=A0A5M6ZJU6_9PROT|nr:thioredoxin family protein [Alkalicaulis satelles]KAA5804004.1 thioredoxin family protein [Alkalicaulis satelles]
MRIVLTALAPAFALILLAACSAPEGETALDRPIIPADAEITAPEDAYAAAPPALEALDAAFEAAARDGRRVAAIFGGDWCPDCRIFAGMLEIPELAAFVERHFVIVKIDAERTGELNAEALARYGYEGRLEGYPTVVVTTADGVVINRANAAEWRTARERSPQDVADWFHALITAPAPDETDRVAVAG